MAMEIFMKVILKIVCRVDKGGQYSLMGVTMWDSGKREKGKGMGNTMQMMEWFIRDSGIKI